MEKRRSEARQVRLADFEPVPQDILNILSVGVIRRQLVVPVARTNGKLLVVTTPKQEGQVKPEGIQLLTHCPVDLVYASDEDVRAFITRHYPEDDQSDVLRPVVAPIPESNGKKADPLPIVLQQLLVDAMANSARQVLAQNIGGKITVRQRIRGVLITDLKAALTGPQLTSFFDFLSKMGESRNEKELRTVDAAIEVPIDGDVVQCRFVGSITGDFTALTIHLQKKEERALSPSALGMGPNQVRLIEKFFSHARGLVIFSGNDGDDLEGTLRSCVRDVTTPERHVMAVESSRQTWFPGVEQLVANGDAKRFFLQMHVAFRHAPDVVIVNPVERAEQLELCLSEALKGRFVLARMYAADTADLLTRLLGMGVEPYMLGSALAGIVTQRTLRLLCPSCQEKEIVSRDRLKELGIPVAMQPAAFFQGKGCDACLETGFDRESNIFEVLEMSDDVRARLSRDMKSETLRGAVKAGGLMTLRQVAIHKAINGQTSLSEVLRVTPA